MIILVLFLLGLCFGSFVNAFVWRLHTKKDWVKERSICPNCRHTLNPLDLIPLFSWIGLRGKCRYCKKPISLQYPIVELVTALLFAGSYIFWPYPLLAINYQLMFGLWLGVLVVLMALLVYDIRWMILPDRLVRTTTIIAGILACVRFADQPGMLAFLNPIWGVLCIAGLFYVLFQVSQGKWIGGGDVKLGIPLGLLVGGPSNALLTIFVASVLGSLVGMPMLLKSRKALHARIPFGPFLILATIFVFMFGQSIVEWYKTTIILMS